MKYLFIFLLIIAFTSCGNSNKTVNSEDTETVNGYRYEKGSDEAFTGTVKYKDENGRYYKKVEYDKSGNKIDEKVYE